VARNKTQKCAQEKENKRQKTNNNKATSTRRGQNEKAHHGIKYQKRREGKITRKKGKQKKKRVNRSKWRK
jgi:hypothetical protein